jgi:hypothetical protein
MGDEAGPAPLQGETAWLLTVVLIVVAIINVVAVRVVALPGMRKSGDVTLGTLATTGYMFVEASAVFGVVAAVLSGQGWRVLSFALVALISWGIVRTYLQSQSRTSTEDFPRL